MPPNTIRAQLAPLAPQFPAAVEFDQTFGQWKADTGAETFAELVKSVKYFLLLISGYARAAVFYCEVYNITRIRKKGYGNRSVHGRKF